MPPDADGTTAPKKKKKKKKKKAASGAVEQTSGESENITGKKCSWLKRWCRKFWKLV